MPRPGDLRQRVRIERRTQTPTGFPGEWSDAYADPIERAAKVKPMTGREAERAGQTTADAPHQVTLRAEPSTLEALTPTARLTWLRPDHPLGDVALDVVSVVESADLGPVYLSVVAVAHSMVSADTSP